MVSAQVSPVGGRLPCTLVTYSDMFDISFSCLFIVYLLLLKRILCFAHTEHLERKTVPAWHIMGVDEYAE